ncbi:MAG TPA: hypothetical protein VGM90_14425 [Kofleriaceae bacterium]|jgi:uncharacterized membrane protein
MTKTLLFVALLVGCTQSAGESTGIQAVTCATDSDLTWDNFGETFISENCLSCHSGKESPNLSTLAKVQANSSKILEKAVYTDAMPEGDVLDVESRKLLGEWLACGAP